MAPGSQQEAPLVRAMRTENLRGPIDEHWAVQAVALKLLHALVAGPSEAPSEVYLGAWDAEQVHQGGPGPEAWAWAWPCCQTALAVVAAHQVATESVADAAYAAATDEQAVQQRR